MKVMLSPEGLLERINKSLDPGSRPASTSGSR